MRTLGNPRPSGSRFGTPEAIGAACVRRLPEAMRAEAVLMLADMGECRSDIAARLGIELGEVFRLMRGPLMPIRPAGSPVFTGDGGEG